MPKETHTQMGLSKKIHKAHVHFSVDKRKEFGYIITYSQFEELEALEKQVKELQHYQWAKDRHKEIRDHFFELHIIRNTNDFTDKLKFMEVVFHEQEKENKALEKQVKKYEGLETTLKPLTLIELVEAFNEVCLKKTALEKELEFEKQANFAGTIKQLSEDKVSLEKQVKELKDDLNVSPLIAEMRENKKLRTKVKELKKGVCPKCGISMFNKFSFSIHSVANCGKQRATAQNTEFA